MSIELHPGDDEGLARVAEGRPAQVPADSLVRLLAAGLIQRPDRAGEGSTTLELTPAGLARIRSSDQ